MTQSSDVEEKDVVNYLEDWFGERLSTMGQTERDSILCS